MKKLLPVIVVAFLLPGGCYYDKFEDYKPAQACDTARVVSYAAKIKPILDAQCNSCHAGTSPIGGLQLDSYSSVKTVAESGKLLSSITWDGKAQPMPKGAYEKIDPCSIKSITNWINSNYPQ